MPELLRAFTTRQVELLSPSQVASWGIQTHPEGYHSPRYLNWLLLCKSKDSYQLTAVMTKFLLGSESIKKLDDLGPEWASIIRSVFSMGTQLAKEKVVHIVKRSKLEIKERNSYSSSHTALADTILALAYLKNLSHPQNIDYLSAFKVLVLVGKFMDHEFEHRSINAKRFIESRVLLPPCFFRIDPCDAVKNDLPFPFLEKPRESSLDGTQAKGCMHKDCGCKPNDECVEQNKCCAKPRIDIIDLMVINHRTRCYRAGDLSYIKNVLEGEMLSTKHRSLNRIEEEFSTESEIRQFEERYLQTEDKSAVGREVEEVMKQDKAIQAGLTTNSSFGVSIKEIYSLSFGTNSTTNLSSSQSKAITNKATQNYSKDVINRATKQIEQKVRKFSSTKTLSEREETNEHSFSNVSGANINGQYLYVDKISEGQVFNYGKVGAIPIILPEPASLYKSLFVKKFEGIEPKKPADIKINATDIHENNLEELIKQYGLGEIDSPPAEYVNVTAVFRKNTPVDDHRKNGVWQSLGSGTDDGPKQVDIPSGYYSQYMQANLDGSSVHLSLHNTNCNITFTLGGRQLRYGDVPTQNPESLPMLEGSQSISVFYSQVKNYGVQVTVRCKRKDETYLNWQTYVYELIKGKYDKEMAEYQKAYSEYMAAKNEFDAEQAILSRERNNQHPFILRQIERQELKRMAITYISCQFFDQFDAMKSRVEPCGFPEMNIREAEKEGRIVQFFEQAFEWELMTYIFYPYFWGRKCTWQEKLKEESSDLIFQRFLEAGSCHVLVPIRAGWIDYIQYFLATGEIWNGNTIPPLPMDLHYVSIAQELREEFQNFNADRDGTIDTTNGSPIVILNNSDHYWNTALAALDTLAINADLDRVIVIDCQEYRIVDIQENLAVTNHTSWEITLERNYEGATATNLKWSTGAVFVGAPWEFVTPTTLTFLREKSTCLPCYPLTTCIEP